MPACLLALFPFKILYSFIALIPVGHPHKLKVDAGVSQEAGDLFSKRQGRLLLEEEEIPVNVS